MTSKDCRPDDGRAHCPNPMFLMGPQHTQRMCLFHEHYGRHSVVEQGARQTEDGVQSYCQLRGVFLKKPCFAISINDLLAQRQDASTG